MQSIQEAVIEEQTQRIAQNKKLELMKNHYSGDLEQSYEDCLRNVKSEEVTSDAAAILDTAPLNNLSIVARDVFEAFMQDTLNNHSRVPTEGGFMSNLVSEVKTELNRGIAQEINQGLTFTLREDIFEGRNFRGRYFRGIYFRDFVPKSRK